MVSPLIPAPLVRGLRPTPSHSLPLQFRTIKTTNKAIQSKLLSVDGARDVLVALGFVDLGDVLVLPSDADMASLQEGIAVVVAAAPPVEEKKSGEGPAKVSAGASPAP